MAFFNGFQFFLHSSSTFISLLLLFSCLVVESADFDYKDALTKSILFLEGQRSGKLPPDQRMIWRGDSALDDGSLANVNLSGGYYDAGDNLKFNLPMAYTTTMLSWSAIEYGKKLGAELKYVRAAIRWGTDYLLKCSAKVKSDNVLYAGVGEPGGDHNCWERPEDMTTPRTVYSVSAKNPGSDVAGETAAALAAASLVFRRVDPIYSKLLLDTSKDVMQFAMDYLGAYSTSIPVCPYYCSYSGYKDELFWGAAWLFRATNLKVYYDYIKSMGVNDSPDIFSWDNKFAGAYVLLSRRYFVNNDANFQQYSQQAQNFMCKVLPKSPSLQSTQYTPGGLMYKIDGSNLQYVTAIISLFNVYAKYMKAGARNSTTQIVNCGGVTYSAADLRAAAKSQVDYILGTNPMRMSYMVGFNGSGSEKYPQRIHHRGSSIPSIHVHPSVIACGDGFQYLYAQTPNPNILTGAITGGPDRSDRYADDRNAYAQSEPTTYINAAILGPLAHLAATQK